MKIYGIIAYGKKSESKCKIIRASKISEDNCRFSRGNFLLNFKKVKPELLGKYTSLSQMFFKCCFEYQSGFTKQGVFEIENEELIKRHFEEKLDSLYLPIFLSGIENANYDNAFITGDIDFENAAVKNVKEIECKFDNVKLRIRKNGIEDKKNLFLYISDKDVSLDTEGLNIEIKRFEGDSSLSEILYFLKNSTRYLPAEKNLYENDLIKELQEKPLKEVNFYFTGEESSDGLFSTNIFKQIGQVIKDKSTEFNINIYLLKYFSSQQRMNSFVCIPKWCEKFKDKESDELNYNIINLLSDKISLFHRRLQFVSEMLVDVVLEYAATDRVKINFFDTDGEDFFDEKNNGEVSAVKIEFEDNGKILGYSKGNQGIYLFNKKADCEYEDDITIQVECIANYFTAGKTEQNKKEFVPFVLMGFPATGKSITTLKLAQLENPLEDMQNIKIFSSDDRINEAAFADSEVTKTFRSQFDWAYPSRKDVERKALAVGVSKEFYKNIEYEVRNNAVCDSINLAYITHSRVDLGAKEILDATVRSLLYKRGFKNILMLNAKTPLPDDLAKKIDEFENNWKWVKENLHDIRNREDKLFEQISLYAFNEYFKDVFFDYPEKADLWLRRNIFAMKNTTVNNVLKKDDCNNYGTEKVSCNDCVEKEKICSKHCRFWIEARDDFKNTLKDKIWDERFEYYLRYCTDIIVREESPARTAAEILKVINNDVNANFNSGLPETLPNFYRNTSGFAKMTVNKRFSKIFKEVCEDWNWDEFIKSEKVGNWAAGTTGSLAEYLEHFSADSLKVFFENAKFLESEFFLYHIIKVKWDKDFPEMKDKDYFFMAKEKDWENKKDEYLIEKINALIYQSSSLKKENLANYLNYMTTGNSHDLSQKKDYIPTDEKEIKYLTSDSVRDDVFNFMVRRKYNRFDILCDNAGVELLSDYLFALYLLQTNTVQVVYMHLKPIPMFVSDATNNDFTYMKQLIKKENETIYQMVTQYEKERRLIVIHNEGELFSTPYFSECNFISDIMRKKSELIILKGDLNYRRLVGDLAWEYSQSIRPIIRSFIDCPILCLRCIKSDLLLGLSQEDIEKTIRTKNKEFKSIKDVTPEELSSGMFATIQFL